MKTIRPPSIAHFALAAGIAATVLAWWLVGHAVDREARAEFANSANLATGVIERRMQRYIDLLYGLEALASHDPSFSRADFTEYVTALDIGRRFAGVRAVQFVQRVQAPDDEKWFIDYMAPGPGNEAAAGLDIRTRDVPREAAERARDTGDPVMTCRYRLVQ